MCNFEGEFLTGTDLIYLLRPQIVVTTKFSILRIWQVRTNFSNFRFFAIQKHLWVQFLVIFALLAELAKTSACTYLLVVLR